VIRVVLPTPLRTLAQLPEEVELELESDAPATLRAVIDGIEAAYPTLRGTIRDQATRERRNFLRFFACGEDLSHESLDDPLPARIARGEEPLLVVAAIAGG
jgi:molybdopterin synthase sulfur carrier subunit